MSLKPRLSNSPIVDSDGYTTGIVAEIIFLEDGESEYSGEQYEFNIAIRGTQKDINLKIWTGVKINPEQYSTGKSKEFNKLTRLCITLGLVSVTELKAIKTEADLDKLGLGEKLESLKGRSLRFKLVKNPKGKGLSQIDLDSLELIEA